MMEDWERQRKKGCTHPNGLLTFYLQVVDGPKRYMVSHGRWCPLCFPPLLPKASAKKKKQKETPNPNASPA